VGRKQCSDKTKLIDRDADFRDITQRQWFDSAMKLLDTQYRAAVIAGLVMSIGSSIESLVSPLLLLTNHTDLCSRNRVWLL
jgi:hypothetical protein